MSLKQKLSKLRADGHITDDEYQILKQEPRIGHWITINDCELNMAFCSECGDIVDSRMISKYSYCHCGAKMEIEE